MSFEVKVPAVGESITEGVLAGWERKDGDFVETDDPLFVLETDKVTMTINAEQTGRLKIQVSEGETVQIGQVVATLDTDADAPAEVQKTEPGEIPAAAPAAAGNPPAEGDAANEPEESLSPAVRRLVAEHQLNPADIPGSGRGGRVTKEDVIRFIERPATGSPPPAPEKPPKASVQTPGPRPVEARPRPWPGGEAGRQTRQPMTQLRKRIAQRLVEAQRSAAILTTFNECDMSRVMAWRAKHKDRFRERHGVGLGFMSFFLKASVSALKSVPQVNSQIDGDDVVQNHFYDIGVAVGTERGLVVPVVRDVDRLSFAELEETIADLAQRAHNKQLTLEELSGGCFTVSNGGVYGSLLSTPILNPPQSGILGMHGIKNRPMAIGDKIEIRPMMYLALSYDHRIIDGRESVAFLRRVVECIEDPERMLLEV